MLRPRAFLRVAVATVAAVGLTLSGAVPIDTLAAAGTPALTAVSSVLPTPAQSITLSGTGFGSMNPYDGTSTYLRITDVTADWTAGYNTDTISTDVTSWSDSQIVISGFGGEYGHGIFNAYVLSIGDVVDFDVWNSQTGLGPASIAAVVSSGSTTPAQTSPPNTSSCSGGSYQVSSMCEGGPPVPVAPSPSAPQPQQSGGSAIPFTVDSQGIQIACTVNGVQFQQCLINTGNTLSAILPASLAGGVNVPDQEAVSVLGTTGQNATGYAGLGTVGWPGGTPASAYITVLSGDNLTEPNIGLPTLMAMCPTGMSIAWNSGHTGGNLTCQ